MQSKGKVTRFLSVALTLCMLLSTMVFQGMFASAQIDVGGTIPEYTFYVPETIYLRPGNGGTIDYRNFQYYLNRDQEVDGALSNVQSTFGNIYFYCPGATNISNITCNGASVNISSINAFSGGIKASVNGGYLSSAQQQGTSSQLTWSLSFEYGGSTYSATAYSTVYAPNRNVTASGVYGYDHNNAETCVSGILWIQGASKTADATYVDRDSSEAGRGVLYQSISGKSLDPLVAGITAPDNSRPSAWGTTTSPFTGATRSFLNCNCARENKLDGDDEWVVHVDANRTPATIYVDTSRYSNLNQIPNLRLGYMITDRSNTDQRADWYVSDATSDVKNPNSNATLINSSDIDLLQHSYWRDDDKSNACYGECTGTLIASFGGSVSTNGSDYNPGIKYDGAINLPVSGEGENIRYYRGCACGSHTWTWGAWIDHQSWAMSCTLVTLKVNTFSKASLRTEVNNDLGKYIKGYYTDSSWSAYESALKAAAKVLGDPAATKSDCDSARTALVNAAKALTKLTGTVTVTHKSTNGTVLATETKTFNYGDTVSASANTFAGYSYKSVSPSTLSYVNVKTAEKSWTFTYAADEYTITYDLKGGKPTGTNPTKYTSESDDITLSNPEREGFTFIGWTGSNGDTPDTTLVIPKGSSGNRSYNANWLENPSSLVIDPAGGSLTVDSLKIDGTPETFMRAHGVKLNIPVPVKPGYTFKGWVRTNNYGTLSSLTEAAVYTFGNVNRVTDTITATWEANSYKVNYDLGYTPNKITSAAFTGVEYGAYLDRQSAMSAGFKTTYDEATGILTIHGIFNTNNTADINQEDDFSVISLSNVFDLSGIKEPVLYCEYVSGTTTAHGDTNNKWNEAGSFGIYFLDSSATEPVSPSSWEEASVQLNGISQVSAPGIDLEATGRTKAFFWIYDFGKVTFNNYKIKLVIKDKYEINDVTFDAPYGELALDPERTGYNFDGWYTQDGLGITSTDLYKAPGDSTVYARWVDSQKPVANVTSSNNVAPEQTVTFVFSDNDSLGGYCWGKTNPADEAVTYNAISGKNHIASSTVNEEGTYYLSVKDAQGNANTYPVDFFKTTLDPDGGEVSPATVITRKGYSFNLPEVSRRGYSFDKWADGDYAQGASYKPESTATLTAKWNANTYDVIFNANGGEGTMKTQTHVYDVAANLRANTFTRKGYAFAGWATYEDGEKVYDDAQVIKNLAEDGSVTLFALWTANKFTVSFDSEGGEGTMDDQTFTYDVEQALSGSKFTKTGYSMDGWATSAGGEKVYDDGQTVKNLAESGNIKLYASWKANEYQVIFNANGGEGEMDDQTLTYDSRANLTANAFIKTGYTFEGWTTSPDGDVKYANGQEVLNLVTGGTFTLYAVWAPIPYKVVFDANGGEGNMDSVNFVYEVEQALPANSFTRTGYTFAGWATSADGYVEYADGATVKNIGSTDVVTLYAVWTANTYTLYIDVKTGESAPESVTATYDSFLPTIEVPQRSGYTFMGYFTQPNGGGEQYFNGDGTGAKIWDLTDDGAVDLYSCWTRTNGVVTGVKLNYTNNTVGYKQNFTLVPTVTESGGKANYTVTYSTKDAKTATVDLNGKVKGRGKGSTVITCTVADEYGNTVSADCTVKVKYLWWQWLIIIFLLGFIWYI